MTKEINEEEAMAPEKEPCFDESISEDGSITSSDFPGIIEEICSKIEDDDMKSILHCLSLVNKYLRDNKTIPRHVLEFIENDFLFSFLSDGKFIDNTAEGYLNFIIVGEFFANLSYHSLKFCAFLVRNTSKFEQLNSLVTLMNGELNDMIYVTTTLVNTFEHFKSVITLNYLFKFLVFVDDNQENDAGLLVSNLISVLGVSPDLAIFKDMLIRISNLLCDVINEKKAVAINLMWFIYNVVHSATIDLVAGRNKMKWSLVLHNFITEKLLDTLAEMLASEGDVIPNRIALYCFSCLILSTDYDIINILIPRIDLNVFDGFIRSLDPQFATYALIFVQNYVNSINFNDIANAHIDEALFFALHEGCDEVKESSAYAIAALFHCAIESIKSEWIDESVLSDLVQIIGSTTDINLQRVLSCVIGDLVRRVPAAIFTFSNSGINDTIEKVLQYDICDEASPLFNYEVYKALKVLQDVLKGYSDEDENGDEDEDDGD